MNTEFFNALEVLEKEKGIPKDYMLAKVEAALISAFKREYGSSNNVRILLDPVKKDMKLFRQQTVVEEVVDPDTEITLAEARVTSKRIKLGDIYETELKPKNFRRLSAQSAKQVIIQGIREAERMMMIKEYESKKEEIITASVDKIDPETGDAVLNTGTGRAVLLKAEQIPGEYYEVGDRIKVFVSEVRSEFKGPIVSLSRTHSGLVRRMFELEVPEIRDGTVVIRGIAREAGSRTKIAVFSNDENVDAVGSCIGEHGMRINSIIDELGGEKIDIVRYSETPTEFVKEALSPAKVLSVDFDGERFCRVTVDPDQLSLAIGKEGQNARLAARLTGFKIDIRA